MHTSGAIAEKKKSQTGNLLTLACLAVVLAAATFATWQLNSFFEAARRDAEVNAIGRPLSESDPELSAQQSKEIINARLEAEAYVRDHPEEFPDRVHAH